MPTDSVELRKHDEKTCTDMRFLHQVFPTLDISCSSVFLSRSFLHSFIPMALYSYSPILLQSVCFLYPQQAAPCSTRFPAPVTCIIVRHCSYMDLFSLFMPSVLGGPTRSDKISLAYLYLFSAMLDSAALWSIYI